ncbi:CPBP family intramembrane metalloprotease [Listeria monocytogenes]|nr:CPBP family intramembrane metalloprotease [Listeria monocytogenes]
MRYILLILIFYTLSMLVSRAITKWIRGNIGLTVLRVSLAYCPYLFIFIFIPLPDFSFSLNLPLTLASILMGLALIGLDYKNFLYGIKKEYAFMNREVSFPQLFSRASEGILAPICEEMFFRGIIPLVGGVYQLTISILSIFLFNLSHYFGNDKSLVYHLKLIAFSLISTALYMLSHNIIYCILFHIFYNLPYVYANYHRYFFHQKKEGY